MPEEGPEPQEWVEKAAEHGHEESHGAKPRNMRSALTAAILAVLAAIGGLLSGHAVNEAILLQSEGILIQTRASDQWAYYQAKSTKQLIYESSAEMATQLGKPESPFAQRARRYEEEKKEIEAEARKLELEAQEKEQDSARKFARHQRYSFGIAAFQVGIVLASVSIMVANAWAWPCSILAGLIGVLYLLAGAWPR